MFKKSNDKKSQTTRDCLLFLSLQQPVKNPSLGLQQILNCTPKVRHKTFGVQFKAASIVNKAYFIEQ